MPPSILRLVKIEHVAKAQISNSRFGLVTMQPEAALFAVSDAPDV
jgi:hypothetical protein